MSFAETPPPPSEAQRLVAKAGFTVYEGGNSIFSEPVLVYIGMGRRSSSEFKIHDHVDRPLGYATLTNRGLASFVSPCEIRDPWGAPLLQVRSRSAMFRLVYQVEGVASGTFSLPTIGANEMTIERSSEPFGFVTGFSFGMRRTDVLEVLDHNRKHVAKVKVFVERRNMFSRRVNHVITIDPNLDGELRRLLIALPVVIEEVRQRRESRS